MATSRGRVLSRATSAQGTPGPWRPRVEDQVKIKASRLLGTVMRIEGQDDAQRFVLRDFPPAGTDAGSEYELAQAAKVARSIYALAELEPHVERCRHSRTSFDRGRPVLVNLTGAQPGVRNGERVGQGHHRALVVAR